MSPSRGHYKAELAGKRILLVANSFIERGGVEARALELCRHIQSHGGVPMLVTLRVAGRYLGELRKTGVEARHIHCYRHTRGVTWPNPMGIFRLARLILHLDPHAILGLQPPSHYFLRLACAFAGRRAVVMERLSYHDRSGFFRWLDRRLDRSTGAVVAVSGALGQEIRVSNTYAAGKVVVVENGIHPPVSVASPALDRDPGTFVIGCVGSLSKRKRQAFLVQALPGIQARVPGIRVKLLLVGGPEDEHDLTGLAQSMNVAENVHLAGHQEDVWPWLASMDLFCFPSTREGLGNAWVEALHAGLPLVIADLPPFNGYVRDGVEGRLYPADDLIAFQSAVVGLIQQPNLRERLAAQGRDMARKQFDAERNLATLVDCALEHSRT